MIVNGLNLLILNSILNAFDEEDIYIFKLPSFVPKSDKEIELCNLLKINNPQFSFIVYLMLQKMNYVAVLNNVFGDDEMFDEMMFFDLSFAYLFQEAVILYDISSSDLKKIMPKIIKFTETYSFFLSKTNNIFSYKVENIEDFEKIIKASFSFNIRREVNKLKKLFIEAVEELNEFNEIFTPIKKQILHKANFKINEEIIFDENEIYFFSVYPEFVFFSKFLNRENISTLYIAKKLKKSIYNTLNNFYMIKYIYDYDNEFKDKLLDQLFFEKYLLQLKFSFGNVSLKPDNFRFNFIKDFNKKRLENTLIDSYIEKYLSFNKKKYGDIKELENKFNAFVFKMSEELSENPSIKILKPQPDAKNEITILANKINKILKKD